MTWTYAYTPNIWPLFLTVLFLLILAVYSWRRFRVPGALPFMVGCLFTSLATFGLLMTNLAVEPGNKIFWFGFMSSWLLPGATAVTCFVLEYAWPGRWLTRRNLVLLSILPLFFIVYFLGRGYTFLGSIDFTLGDPVTVSYNLFGRLFAGSILILSLINLIVFAWLFTHSPQHRWPVVLMAASQVAVRIIMFGQGPSLAVQVFNIPVFALPYLTYAIALFGFRIFDPIPLARQMAIDQLYAGMIVLDPQRRVVSLNPAAERILGASASQAQGKPVRDWMPAYPVEAFDRPDGSEFELSLGSEDRLRCYTLAVSQLKDFRGLDVGHLLMLRDITEQKQAQAQIVEQQRTLATQIERERLARELHDSLGQVLSYTSLQVETSAQLSLEGQGDAAAAQLARLGSVVREAHSDLREHILNLHSTASLEQPFLPAAKQYLDGFSRSYPVRTILSADPALGEGAFTPDTKLQLLRILQEAVSNARKHGKARQVQVSILKEDGRLCMTIQDDGCGFHPQEVERSGDCHYGLQFMRDRAEALGGDLQVISAPGLGTRVVLAIPNQE